MCVCVLCRCVSARPCSNCQCWVPALGLYMALQGLVRGCAAKNFTPHTHIQTHAGTHTCLPALASVNSHMTFWHSTAPPLLLSLTSYPPSLFPTLSPSLSLSVFLSLERAHRFTGVFLQSGLVKCLSSLS